MDFKRHLRDLIYIITSCVFFISAGPELKGAEDNSHGLSIRGECSPVTAEDSIFTINYIVSYEGKDTKDVRFTFDKNGSDCAKFLRFLRTSQKTTFTFDSSGEKKITHEDTWTAMWRAISPGKFISPSYKLTVLTAQGVDTLDLQAVRMAVKINKTDKELLKKKEKDKKEAIRKGKQKDNILAFTVLPDSNYVVGDTLVCRLLLLNKVSDPLCNIVNVSVDTTFVLKGCAHELHYNDSITTSEIEYNGVRYLKIFFAELIIIPSEQGFIKVPEIKLSGVREIMMKKKIKYWVDLPVLVDTYEYKVHTDPKRVYIARKPHDEYNPDI